MTISGEVKERVKYNYPTDRMCGMRGKEIADKYRIHRNTLVNWLREWGYTHYGWMKYVKEK